MEKKWVGFTLGFTRPQDVLHGGDQTAHDVAVEVPLSCAMIAGLGMIERVVDLHEVRDEHGVDWKNT